MIHSFRSPVRVDLSGGTLDCWPLYLFVPEAITVNLAVEIYTAVSLEERQDGRVRIEMKEFKKAFEFDSPAAARASQDDELSLLLPHLNYWKPERGFTLKMSSESPVGAGLGGSSSLCISLIKVFSQWLEKPMRPLEMVRLACNLETQLLGKPAGTQDYFPAIQGGLNFIEYHPDGIHWSVTDDHLDVFRKNMRLVYTGRAHHSGLNNWDVIKKTLEGDAATLSALKDIAEISVAIAAAIRSGDWAVISKLWERETEARLRLSAGFSSPEIEKIKSIAQAHDAAVKICGAGGGGCVLIWCLSAGNLKTLESAIQKSGFKVMTAGPSIAPYDPPLL